jgi:hypothetical protein
MKRPLPNKLRGKASSSKEIIIQPGKPFFVLKKNTEEL